MSGRGHGTPSERPRPFDGRWATRETIAETFGITPSQLNVILADRWVKSRTFKTTGDHGKILTSLTLYCLEDIHQYLETIAHEPSQAYTDRFWTGGCKGTGATAMNANARQTARAKRTFALLSESMRRTVQDVARARGCEPWEVLAEHFSGARQLPELNHRTTNRKE